MTATYDCIATTTLGSAAADITFTSISGSFTDLIAIGYVRCSNTVTDQDCYIQFNGDTAANYSRTVLYGDGSTAASTRNTGSNLQFAWGAAGASASANVFSPCIFHFMNYSNSTTNKTGIYRYQLPTYVTANVGLWRSTSAITSIKFAPVTGNFATGTSIALYGVKAE